MKLRSKGVRVRAGVGVKRINNLNNSIRYSAELEMRMRSPVSCPLTMPISFIRPGNMGWIKEVERSSEGKLRTGLIIVMKVRGNLEILIGSGNRRLVR